MSSLEYEIRLARAQSVFVTDDTLTVDLSDGRTISVPLGWYPRLMQGNADERKNWRLVGQGQGMHWPDLDEDVAVENLILGKPSGESQQSLRQWQQSRATGV